MLPTRSFESWIYISVIQLTDNAEVDVTYKSDVWILKLVGEISA
jgi:hypothetical protein